MVFNTNITSVSSSQTLDTGFDVYIVDASTSGNITLTLPNINADGIQYKLIRIDTNTGNTVTVAADTGQEIDTTTSIDLPVQKVLDIQSFDSGAVTPQWYIVNLPGVRDILDCRYYDVYQTVTQSILGTATTITFDTQRVISDPGTFTLSAGEITANITDLYKICYRVTTTISTGATRSICRTFLELNTGSGFTEVPGTTAYTYNRNTQNGQTTAETTLLLNLNAGNIIRVRAIIQNGTNIVTVTGGSEIVINNICGMTSPASIFGSNFLTASNLPGGTTTVQSPAFETILTLAIPSVPLGTYRIGYTYEVGITPNAVLMTAQAVLDPTGTPVIMSNSTFESDDDFHTMGGFYYVTSFTGGVNAIIRYNRVSGTGIAEIRNVALEFWRIS